MTVIEIQPPVVVPAAEAPPVFHLPPREAHNIAYLRRDDRKRRLLAACKWSFLVGCVALLCGIPELAWQSPHFWVWVIPPTAMLSAIVGTALPRLLAPRWFGRWFDVTQAARDGFIAGLVTAAVYLVAHVLSTQAPGWGRPAEELETWLRFRMPVLVGSVAVGLMLARHLTSGGGRALRGSLARTMAQTVIYAALTSAVYLGMQRVVTSLAASSLMPVLMLTGGLLIFLGSSGLLFFRVCAPPSTACSRLPFSETITVIGGKGVGKTMLLTMAFHELSTRLWGNVIVRGTEDTEHHCQALFDTMEETRRWPNESLKVSALPFHLTLGLDDVAAFDWNDYPGGIVSDSGNPMMAEQRPAFIARATSSTALVVVVDTPRLAGGDTRLLAAYSTLLREIYRELRIRQGRLPAVCVAMTKCDAVTGLTRQRVFRQQVGPFIETVKHMAREAGDRSPRVETFFTSSVEGTLQENGQTTLPPRPFRLRSRGCAELVLWIVAQALRGDHDLAEGVEDFFGTSKLGAAVVALEEAARG